MKERLVRLPVGGSGVLIKMEKSPRLELLGLKAEATVICLYKSRGVVVLEIGRQTVAVRRRELRNIWVDY